MKIEQFYDKGLAHASYAILSDREIALVDPARDPEPYYDFANKNNAKIVAVIETHPHADFVSSHAEIAHKTGARIYVSKLVGADYPHQGFDEGQEIKIGEVSLKALNTPGHSPDSVSIVLLDKSGKEHAVFTGDTLFIGDVGRPDLREKAGSIQAKREELAGQMYESTRNKLMTLPDQTMVYPAHGAGSLCGKNLSPDLVSTIGREKKENYALQEMSKEEFISLLLEDQPFIPKYFGFDVDINKQGAEPLEKSVRSVPILSEGAEPEKGVLIIDTRNQHDFRKGHLPGSLNIMEGGKFETWLGSVVGPDEKFYLLSDSRENLDKMIHKAAKIGYEQNIKAGLVNPGGMTETMDELDVKDFTNNPDKYTILDIRNPGEVKSGKPFPSSLHIPLPELRERVKEVPSGKPVVVHCAGGYRSAAGASILLEKMKGVRIYDLGEEVLKFN